jgi:hypothetical protein
MRSSQYCDPTPFFRVWKGWCDGLMNPKEQQDAVEFFLAFLNYLPSELSDYFNGTRIDYTDGITEPFHESDSQQFWTLCLPIRGMHCMDDSIKAILKSEIHPKYNIGSSEIAVAQKFRVTKAPPVLVCQLGRFCANLTTNRMDKVTDPFEFSMRFNFQEFMDDPLSPPLYYQLVGFVAHLGNVYGGHYTSYIRKEKWWRFDDISVSSISEADALSVAFGRSPTSASVLFYAREGFATDSNPPLSFFDEPDLPDSDACFVNSMFSPWIAEFILLIDDAHILWTYFFSVCLHSKSVLAGNVDERLKRVLTVQSLYPNFLESIGSSVSLILDAFVHSTNEIALGQLISILSKAVESVEPSLSFAFCDSIVTQLPSFSNHLLRLSRVFVVFQSVLERSPSFLSSDRATSWSTSFALLFDPLASVLTSSADFSPLFACLQSIFKLTDSHTEEFSDLALKVFESSKYVIPFMSIVGSKPGIVARVLHFIIDDRLQVNPKQFCEKIFTVILNENTVSEIGNFFNELLSHPTPLLSADVFLKELTAYVRVDSSRKMKILQHSPRLLVPFLVSEQERVQSNCKELVSTIITAQAARGCAAAWGAELIDMLQNRADKSVSLMNYIQTWEELTFALHSDKAEELNCIVQALEILSGRKQTKEGYIETLLTFAARFPERVLLPVVPKIQEKVFSSGVFRGGQEYLRTVNSMRNSRQSSWTHQVSSGMHSVRPARITKL